MLSITIEALAQHTSLSKDFLLFIQLSKSSGEPHALLREGKEVCFSQVFPDVDSEMK
jgi:hypothetical protein